MKRPVRKLALTEAAWLAGVIDGEGSISIGLYNYKREGRRVLIQMGNTNERFVRKVRSIIGCGSRVRRHKFAPSHKGRKLMYCYSLKGSIRCYFVLKQVLPYLIIKKQLAKKILKEIKDLPFGRWGQYGLRVS